MLAVAARETSKIKLGHFVTNPATRDPTVLASCVRDAPRPLRRPDGDGHRPRRLRRPLHRPPADEGRGVRALCAMVREFMNGREVDWNDKDAPAEVGARGAAARSRCGSRATGPKALAVAGRVADGVIIQLADPEIIQWIMDTARKAAEEAGRDPAQLKCIVGAPATSPTISPTRASRCAGSRRWSRTTSWI